VGSSKHQRQQKASNTSGSGIASCSICDPTLDACYPFGEPTGNTELLLPFPALCPVFLTPSVHWYVPVGVWVFFWLSYLSDQLTEASELAQEKWWETDGDVADVGLPLPAAVTCPVG